jgi:hypothetical protein
MHNFVRVVKVYHCCKNVNSAVAEQTVDPSVASAAVVAAAIATSGAM